jgi:hypothetical protein
MPRGSKPLPPGEAKTTRNAVHQWQFAEGEGWQHGRRPNPPAGLTDAGKRAWRQWLGSWWACFYTPDDLPGLELTVKQYDLALAGAVDVKKAETLMDKYGITPKGRQDLRWARKPVKAPEQAAPAAGGAEDEVAKRRQARSSRVS